MQHPRMTKAQQPTLAEQLDRKAPDNWMLIRLLAATAVVLGHSIALAHKGQSGAIDPIQKYLPGTYSGSLAVEAFFFISGFLITHAVLRDGSIMRYLGGRVLRVIPGYWVMLVLSTLACGLAASTSFSAYLLNADTLRYIWQNALLLNPEYHIPGVFADHKSTAINGSLWSLFVEVQLYVFSGAALLLAVLQSRLAASVAGLALVVFAASRGGFQTPEAFNFTAIGMYGIGMLTRLHAHHVRAHRSLIFLAALVLFVCRGTDFQLLSYDVALVLFLIYFAYGAEVPKFKLSADLSYGIFLYSYPIQQLLAHFAPQMNPYPMFVISWLLSAICAAGSWWAVEKPALSLKARLFKKAE
jgi:peptidoglycan/LPS O-acetylase OafA/YrhL